ncbi:MAG: PolC-type DNA polymerase III [Streptococcaceae bacterium]|jgi:DNA polymerase-3 subunit alpha (Gram-positive type)|nr:PolC-type DNA polymerase III [Streptococcaceae bacterium]
MNDKFEILLDQINMPLEVRNSALFQTGAIDSVLVDSAARTWNFELLFDTILPVENYKMLSALTKKVFSGIAETTVSITARDGSGSADTALINAYYQLIFDEKMIDAPAFTGIFKQFKFDDEQILQIQELPGLSNFKVTNFPQVNMFMRRFGFKKFNLEVAINAQLMADSLAAHEFELAQMIERATAQQAEFDASKTEKTPTSEAKSTKKQGAATDKSVESLKLGRDIRVDKNNPVTPMNSVQGQEVGVIFEGWIFKAEHVSGTNRATKKEWHRLEFFMTDYTTSYKVQKFGSRPAEIELFDQIKKGQWVRVQGNLVMGQFDREPTLDLKALIEIAPKNVRKDEEPEDVRRVEFHTHTNMSTMDAIASAGDLVAQAAAWGHKAIAITDHGGVQGFPEAYQAGKKHGVKIIYGVEANIVEDTVPITLNETEGIDLHDSTYVVFDIETTGLSARFNDIIQIAASKMHKGNIIASFNEFLDPGYPISSFTTDLTSITDEMVEGSKPLADVLKDFQEFCRGSILVAHNGNKFDIGFMNANYDRVGLPRISEPIIDTLELARNLYPNMKRHGLGPLQKKFGVILEHHHLADQDAEATGRLFFIFLEELRYAHKRIPLAPGENYRIEEPIDHPAISDFCDLNKLLVNADSYKKQRPVHATLYAQTQAGLKNLFKLVSYGNVTYFAGVPRLPRSVLKAHRDGLLVGSACANGEVFDALINRSFDETVEIAKFYDFIEIQPPALYKPLLDGGTFKSEKEVHRTISDLIKLAEQIGKPVIADGDVHYLAPEDAIYREIIVRSNPGLEINRPMGHGEDAQPIPLPAAQFRTTDEMLRAFSFLGADKAHEIVVKNTQELAAQFDEISPVRNELYTPVMTFDGGETAGEHIARLTYEAAHKMYGNPLPDLIDARLEKELRSIIGNGFSVIYLCAQELIARSNARGYLVGSRGSVGSSLVATMIGVTEVNPLPPHYICPKCQHFEVITDGSFGSGYDMPEKKCPDCGEELTREGQDIPFETFLGFDGDKVPDIDLNFSGEDQPYAHLDVRDIFGAEYAFRAGTIATVADKTAYGYVLGYERDYGKYYRNAEKDRLAAGSTGVKRTTGQHPGGIIVIPNYMDVYDFSPVQYPSDDLTKEWQTTHFDFHAIHDNILKLDILGHDDPTMIRKLQTLSGIDPQTLPLGDPEVLKLFTTTESLGITKEQNLGQKLGTYGVPEMGTFTSMNMIADAKPKTFADLLQISGLSHGTDVWAGNAQDLIKQGIATLSTVIGCRDDIMVYLIHKGLDEPLAFKIMEKVRKGLWNKLPEEERDSYIAHMLANGVPQWYIDSCAKIKYMFPKAHATAYIMMALRVAWFKVHRPMDYYAAWFSIRAGAFDIELMAGPLQSIKDRVKDIKSRTRARENAATPRELDLQTTLELVNEMRERGFKFGKIDVYHSDATDFIIEGDTLIPPFVIMDGLGDAAAKSVIEARKKGEFLSKNELRTRTGLTQTNIDGLSAMGALDGWSDDNQLSLFDML